MIEQLREMTGRFNDDLLEGIAEDDARTVRRVLDRLRRNLDRAERPLEVVA